MKTERVDRRLAAILAADVAAYSRLMGTDEEGTLRRLRAHRRELVDSKIAEHRGRIVKTTGDGMLAEFTSVVDAVRCAADIQRAMVDRNAEAAEDQRIRFRIGVNLGDIIVENDDIFGDGVNVAARLEALAEPGGICISGTVRDHVGDRLPYAFDDMGEQSVKNIARPLRAYRLHPDAIAALPPVIVGEPAAAVRRRSALQPLVALAIAAVVLAIAAGGGWRVWSSRGRSERPVMPATASLTNPVPPLSIVVLPFDNLSKDADQEYFANAVTDDLTTDLSRLANSFVISRTTAFTYKGKPIDVKQIGHDLGVRYVLEGSVRRSGNQVHLNVQLIDAASEAHVWADQIDTNRTDVAAAQSEITGRLANTLGIALVRDAGRRVAELKTSNVDAQDLVLRARDWLSRPASAEASRQAYELFTQALRIDPRSNDAKLGLAGVMVLSAINHFGDSAQQDEATAEKLAREVLDRDPDQGDAHGILGVLLRRQGALTESKTELETQLQLDPNHPGAHRQLGFTLLFLGQPDAAIVEGERAIRLSPRDPILWGAYQLLGMSYLYSGQFDRAIEFLGKSRDMNPRIAFTHLSLAVALAMKGDLDAGKAELKKSMVPAASSYFRQGRVCTKSAACRQLQEQTFIEGLRRLGLPEK